MKKYTLFILFPMTFGTGCGSGNHSPNWYWDLHVVDSNRISDSLVCAIARDSGSVKAILISAGWVLDRSADTLRPETTHAAEEQPSDQSIRFGGRWRTHRDTTLHHAIMGFDDSFEAAKTLRTDSNVLNLDSLTLLTRSGDTNAQRLLNARHAYEGDINGMWTSDALIVRDDSIRAQVIEIKARVIRSDSAKAMLARLGKQ